MLHLLLLHLMIHKTSLSQPVCLSFSVSSSFLCWFLLPWIMVQSIASLYYFGSGHTLYLNCSLHFYFYFLNFLLIEIRKFLVLFWGITEHGPNTTYLLKCVNAEGFSGWEGCTGSRHHRDGEWEGSMWRPPCLLNLPTRAHCGGRHRSSGFRKIENTV